ncbi:MAG TPA: ATP-binding protein [Thermoanaerobaculaceae bacterium]|nr:ATP-binding protein [Thermoanaerobaculaceae bacterium]
MADGLYPRFARQRLTAALADSPVVLVHGPRQCGKTTLARMVGDPAGYAYYNFDDPPTRAAADIDPVGFVAELPPKVVLDEVQRVPQLFAVIKTAVDRDRKPGRFILTGSANVLLLPRLSDSLAGRIEIIRLHPLSQAELARRKPAFLDRLLGKGFSAKGAERLGSGLTARVLAGGFPPALTRRTATRRAAWHRAYLDSIIQRDIRDASRISALDALPKLLQAAAAQTASLFNASALSAPFSLSRTTIRDYLALLEAVFLIERLPPWHSNRLSRLVKTPKLHFGDAGLAASLLDLGTDTIAQDRARFGQLLETFVFQELSRMASWRDRPIRFHHFRDRDGVEVDMVLEQGAHAVAGVEVKAGSTITGAAFSGLRKLQEAAGDRFVRGVVLYDGEQVLPFGEKLQAVPIRLLWEST